MIRRRDGNNTGTTDKDLYCDLSNKGELEIDAFAFGLKNTLLNNTD